jgi:polyhydroxybutyrate depolymerase
MKQKFNKNIRIVVLFSLCLLSSYEFSLAQDQIGRTGKSDCYFELEGVERNFIVYQADNPTNQPMPVVFMFHGTSGNGEKFYNISGWKQKADKEGLIAVFPSSLRYCIDEDGIIKNTTKWNDGKLDDYACKGQDLKDDVKFFMEMINYLKKNYPIDEKRIYASGFSNGANFVSRLTLEASDVLAATAMAAGFLQDTSFQAKSLISSYLSIGDLNIMKSTGELPAWNESIIEMPGLNERVMAMVDKLNLERTFKVDVEDDIITYVFNKHIGINDNEFRFMVIKDLEHKYPNGINNPMVMADVYWDYFERFHK